MPTSEKASARVGKRRRICRHVSASAASPALLGTGTFQAACSRAASPLERALRVTVYLCDLGQGAAVNEVYESFFTAEPPARVAIGVSALPRGAYVEIDAVVAL